MKRRAIAMLLALAALLALAGCGGGNGAAEPAAESPAPEQMVELTLWTYPVGGWGNSGTLSSLIAAFNRENPNIRVSAKALTYDQGDADIEAAAENGGLPDLVLEGPERLVANWGVRGLMAPLNDLWQDEAANAIYDSVRVACHDAGTWSRPPGPGSILTKRPIPGPPTASSPPCRRCMTTAWRTWPLSTAAARAATRAPGRW